MILEAAQGREQHDAIDGCKSPNELLEFKWHDGKAKRTQKSEQAHISVPRGIVQDLWMGTTNTPFTMQQLHMLLT